MNMSLNIYRDQLRASLLTFLWGQWSALGVAGHTKTTGPWSIDPEALLLLTCTVARHDARLFDEVLDWLRLNGSFIHVQRLRRMQQTEGFAGLPVLAGIARLTGRGAEALKWKGLASIEPPTHPESLFFRPDYRPMPVIVAPDPVFARAGFLRDPVVRREQTQAFRYDKPAALMLQLRALLGVNARADIIHYLLTHEAAHPSEIARQTCYFTKTIQDALVDMHRSGVVNVRTTGREKHYWLQPEPWARLLQREHPEAMPAWKPWSAIFIALERTWLKLLDPALDTLDPRVVAVEFQTLLTEIRPTLDRAHLPFPPLRPGENVLPALLKTLVNLLHPTPATTPITQ